MQDRSIIHHQGWIRIKDNQWSLFCRKIDLISYLVVILMSILRVRFHAFLRLQTYFRYSFVYAWEILSWPQLSQLTTTWNIGDELFIWGWIPATVSLISIARPCIHVHSQSHGIKTKEKSQNAIFISINHFQHVNLLMIATCRSI